MLGAVSASANVTRIPARCSSRPAVRLCAIHAHVRHVNTVRRRIGKQPVRYQWQPERYPARRDRFLTYWTRLDRHAHHVLHAYLANSSPVAVIDRIFGSAAPAAVSVARCESGLDPYAHNPSGAAGLFQLMPVHWEAQGYDPYNVVTNTTIAYHIYTHSGWSAWVCQP